MSEDIGIQLQASLGEQVDNKIRAQRNWNNGFLAFGKVLKVHHKRMTADVQLYGTGDQIVSDEKQEGIHSCRIGVNVAGVDGYWHLPYGEIRPLEVGMIVLVGFLRNTQEKPVILNAFHDVSEEIGEVNYNNILTSIYPLEADIDIYRYTKITRLQDVITVDGQGNIEMSTHSKTFAVLTAADIDCHTFDYENLSTKNKQTGETVGLPQSASPPLTFLAVIRDYDKSHETRICLKPGASCLRIMQDGEEAAAITLDSFGHLNITASEAVINAPTTINGNTQIVGSLSVTDDIQTDSQVIAADDVLGGSAPVSLVHHTHPGGGSSGGGGGTTLDPNDQDLIDLLTQLITSLLPDILQNNEDIQNLIKNLLQELINNDPDILESITNLLESLLNNNEDILQILKDLISNIIQNDESIQNLLQEIINQLVPEGGDGGGINPSSQPEETQETLYNTGGLAADIIVNSLSTSQAIRKYLAGDTSDNNYLEVHGETFSFKAGLSPSGSSQVSNPLGEALYWASNPQGTGVTLGANGYPYLDGKRILITTEVTQWPVMAYNYTVQEKARIAFEQESTDGNGNTIYTPTIVLGAGNAQGQNQAIIRKSTEGLDVLYTSNTGAVIGMKCGTTGITQLPGFVQMIASENDLPAGHENMDTLFVIPES